MNDSNLEQIRTLEQTRIELEAWLKAHGVHVAPSGDAWLWLCADNGRSVRLGKTHRFPDASKSTGKNS